MPKEQRPRSHPYRSTPTAPKPQDPNSKAGPSTHKPLPVSQRDPTGLPGVSKIKSSIRQTTRLLSKDNLEPGLRVQTQRRLTSLQADLERAERRGVEKKNGEKYHMVKFFERQKIVRRIKKLVNQLSDAELTGQSRGDLEEEVFSARVMLNYILNYPNENKYIALFPTDPTTTTFSKAESKKRAPLPQLLPSEDTDPTPILERMGKSEKKRLEMLLEVRRLMRSGKLYEEPEKRLEKGRVEGVMGPDVEKVKGKKEGKKEIVKEAEEEDDFFEAGSDSD